MSDNSHQVFGLKVFVDKDAGSTKSNDTVFRYNAKTFVDVKKPTEGMDKRTVLFPLRTFY